jgi:hypothetical protein
LSRPEPFDRPPDWVEFTVARDRFFALLASRSAVRQVEEALALAAEIADRPARILA